MFLKKIHLYIHRILYKFPLIRKMREYKISHGYDSESKMLQNNVCG